MIGLEVLVMPFTGWFLLAGVLVIPVVLLARWASVAGTVTVMRRYRRFTPGAIPVMTWSGLRGGLSVAMALSLPDSAGPQGHPTRSVIVAVTYAVVVFSIIVQGLTVAPLVRRKVGGAPRRTDPIPATV